MILSSYIIVVGGFNWNIALNLNKKKELFLTQGLHYGYIEGRYILGPKDMTLKIIFSRTEWKNKFVLVTCPNFDLIASTMSIKRYYREWTTGVAKILDAIRITRGVVFKTTSNII